MERTAVESITERLELRGFSEQSRLAALAEAHARPPVEVGKAKLVRHFAFQADDHHCSSLIERLEPAQSGANFRFVAGKLGNFTVKLEKHTEFYTCLAFDKSGSADMPVPSLHDLLGTDDHQLLSDVQLLFHDNQASLLKSLPLGQRHVGGIMRGGMEVRTTLETDGTVPQSFSVFPGKMSAHELGRRLQRLLEMETYRVLTLLGLEAARLASPVVTRLESKVDELVARKTRGITNDADLHGQLKNLSDVSAQLNALRATTRFRFSASQAYYDLAVRRLESLEEEKSGDIQSLTGFVRSRLDPAISTIRSVDKRLKDLSLEIANALSLLRTRIDVELNKSNQQSLVSMNRRHRQQLLISQTVEGLSVVAISYYAVGLLSYLIKFLKQEGLLPFSQTASVALTIPIVVGLVWLFMLRLRRHWHSDDEAGSG